MKAHLKRKKSHQKDKSISPLTILACLILMPITVFYIIELEIVRYTQPTWVIPLPNVIFTLFLLIGAAAFARKFVPALALSRQELLTIYVVLSVVTTLCSHDLMGALVSILGHPFWFATAENEWKTLFLHYLPQWLIVSDKNALIGYYEGGSSLYAFENLKAWLKPVFWWVLFITALTTVMLCINTFLRKGWVQREKLTYPIIQLPMEMTQNGFSFFKNRLMWTGFLISALINILNGLSYIFPAIPSIPVKRQWLGHLFTQKPWSAIGYTNISFYPFVIGICFVIPLDLLFSSVFFYWFYKAQLVLGSLLGRESLPGATYLDQSQVFGGALGLIVSIFWINKRYFQQVFSKASGFRRSSRLQACASDDSREPVPYRAAGLILVGSLIFLIGFSYKIGMSFWLIPIYFLSYYLVGTMITRLRAQLGIFYHWFHHISPHYTIITLGGTSRLTGNDLTVFSLYSFFNQRYTAHPMPHQLEAFKIAEGAKISSRRMFYVLVAAAAFGALVIFWGYLHYYYTKGAASGYFGGWSLGYGRHTYSQLQSWQIYKSGANGSAFIFTGIGFCFVVLMMYLRTTFLWWPLHPLGYLVAQSLFDTWLPVLISCLFKWFILRHGGLRAYRRAVPFFLGLALGDYVLGNFWSLASIGFDRPMYQFFP